MGQNVIFDAEMLSLLIASQLIALPKKKIEKMLFSSRNFKIYNPNCRFQENTASEMKLLRIVNEIKVSNYLENVVLAKYQACNGKWMELQMAGNILTTS